MDFRRRALFVQVSALIQMCFIFKHAELHYCVFPQHVILGSQQLLDSVHSQSLDAWEDSERDRMGGLIRIIVISFMCKGGTKAPTKMEKLGNVAESPSSLCSSGILAALEILGTLLNIRICYDLKYCASKAPSDAPANPSLTSTSVNFCRVPGHFYLSHQILCSPLMQHN